MVTESPPSPTTKAPRRRRTSRLMLVSLGLSVALLVAIAVVASRPAPQPGGQVDRFVVSGDPQRPPSAFTQTLPAGTPAPPLDLVTVDGQRVELSALRGRPVVVNFWAVWCEPCKREFPLLVDAYRTHRAAGLEIVGVASRTGLASARDYAKVAGAEWPIALDPGDRTAAAWRAAQLPQTFFIRPDGTLASHHIGELHTDGLNEQLAAIMRRS